MTISQFRGKNERRILIGMITDSSVCGRLAQKWEEHLFLTPWANLIGGWCVKYFNEFNEAPKKHIEEILEEWITKAKNPAMVATVEKFLTSVSLEQELSGSKNSAYLIDLAAKHFTRVRLGKTFREGINDLESGNLSKALERVMSFHKIDMGAMARVAVLQDDAELRAAFEERADSLFTLPGDLGKFFNRALIPEGFVCLMGPEKRGKTTWLTYLAWQAMLQRKRVAFFSVGDESKIEMMRRFAVLGSRNALRAGVEKIPISLTKEGKLVFVEHKRIRFKKGVSAQLARQAFDKTMRERVKSKREFLGLSVHASSSLSVVGIESQLKIWESEDWVPEVIVVDYMDLLAQSGSNREMSRDRNNLTWSEFRGLLQRWHLLGLSATQANAKSANAHLIKYEHFSEDKRKMAHVTGMVGLNQTEQEKKDGLMRLNWVVARNFKTSPWKVVYCAGCFGVGNPAIKTTF